MSDKIKVGSLVGTGEIIDVECGFVPTYVKVFNPNDAGSLWPSIERWNGMAAASGCKCLKQIDSGSTGLSSQAYVTSNGISDFAGEAPGKTLVGTHAITVNLKALTGTSSKYLRDLRVGDTITLNGNNYTIAAITSNTAATIVENAVATETAAIMTRKMGRAAGFTFGLDTDLNVSGEAVFYVAVG